MFNYSNYCLDLQTLFFERRPMTFFQNSMCVKFDLVYRKNITPSIYYMKSIQLDTP
jgi:hypothetical protein